MSLASLTGAPIEVGAAAAQATLVFFLSPTCPVCKKLLPVCCSLQRAEAAAWPWCWPATASPSASASSSASNRSEGFPYVLSTELGMAACPACLAAPCCWTMPARVAARG